MNTVVINGTDKHGVTRALQEEFMKGLGSTQVHEFCVPRDGPLYCTGCQNCFVYGEQSCPHHDIVDRVCSAIDDADLVVVASPAYVLHAPGALKSLLDHMAFRWMPHRPSENMFRKRGVVITQCVGAGAHKTSGDIADSLSWWGISSITKIPVCMWTPLKWNELPAVKREKLAARMRYAGLKMRHKLSAAAPVSALTRIRFEMCRLLQKRIYSSGPPSIDAQYWKEHGWLDKGRPWR